jgi:hypothetical protein
MSKIKCSWNRADSGVASQAINSENLSPWWGFEPTIEWRDDDDPHLLSLYIQIAPRLTLYDWSARACEPDCYIHTYMCMCTFMYRRVPTMQRQTCLFGHGVLRHGSQTLLLASDLQSHSNWWPLLLVTHYIAENPCTVRRRRLCCRIKTTMYVHMYVTQSTIVFIREPSGQTINNAWYEAWPPVFIHLWNFPATFSPTYCFPCGPYFYVFIEPELTD